MQLSFQRSPCRVLLHRAGQAPWSQTVVMLCRDVHVHLTLGNTVQGLAALRAKLGAGSGQNVINSDGSPEIAPVDANGQTFPRTTSQVRLEPAAYLPVSSAPATDVVNSGSTADFGGASAANLLSSGGSTEGVVQRRTALIVNPINCHMRTCHVLLLSAVHCCATCTVHAYCSLLSSMQ